MQPGILIPAHQISPPLMGCFLPRLRNSWCLDSKSSAICQDLIKLCFYTSGWLFPHPLASAPATVLVRHLAAQGHAGATFLASLFALVQGPDTSQNVWQLLRRFLAGSKAGSATWASLWAVDGQRVLTAHHQKTLPHENWDILWEYFMSVLRKMLTKRFS